MDIGSLLATIGADVTQLRSAVAEANSNLDKYAKKTDDTLSKVNSGWGSSSAFIAKSVGAMGLAFSALKVAEFVKGAAMAGARYETLGIVLEQVGKNAGYSAQEMQKYAEGVKSAGIQMDTAREVTIRMAQAQIDLSKAQQLARVAQDTAVIGNINSSEALERMVHGIQTAQTDVLRTIGINVSFEESYAKLASQLGVTSNALSQQQKMQARTNAVMEEGAKSAGVYEKAMETAGKQITSFSRYINDFAIEMGQAFNPATAEAVGAATAAMKDFTAVVKEESTQDALRLLSSLLASFVSGMSDKLVRGVQAGSVALGVLSEAVSLVSYAYQAGAVEADKYSAHLINTAAKSSKAREEFKVREGEDSWMRVGAVWANNLALAMDPVIANLQRGREALLLSEAEQAAFEKRMQKAYESRPEQEIASLKKSIEFYKKYYPEKTQIISEAEAQVAKIQKDSAKEGEAAQKVKKDALSDITDGYKKLTLSTAAYARYKIHEDYMKQTASLKGTNAELEETVRLQYLLIDQQEAYQEFTGWGDVTEQQILDEQARVFKRERDEETKAVKEALEEQEKATEKALKKQEKDYESFSDKVQDYTADIISNWGNMGDTLVKIIKRTVAEMAAALISRQLIVPIAISMGSSLGLGWNGTTFSSMSNLGNMANAVGGEGGGGPLSLFSAGKSIYSALNGGIGSAFTQGPIANIGSSIFGASSWFGGAAAPSTSAFGYAGGNFAAATGGGATAAGIAPGLGAAATGLGSAAAGFMLGKMISGGYSVLGGSIGSSVTTALGTGLGFLVGGPIGSVIGGALGGLVNRMFGRSAPESTGSGISGTLSTSGASIQNYETWKAKGGWFRSDKTGTDYSSIPTELDELLDTSLIQLTSATKSYAEILGLNASQIDGITQTINLSMTGLSDQQKQESLLTAIAEFGDKLAMQYTQITPYLKAHETYTIGLGRLASSLSAVNQALDTLDVNLLQISVAGANAASSLVDLLGGVDGFNAATGAYYDKFYSASEKLEKSVEVLTNAFTAMNMKLPTNIAQYRQLVEAQNLNAQSGREMYAALIAMAPAFAEVNDAWLLANDTHVSVNDDLINSEEALAKARMQARESIQDLVDDLMGGDLAPVQSMEFFTRRYRQMLDEAEGAQGSADFGEKVNTLTSFIPDMLEFAKVYGGNYKGLFESIMQDIDDLSASIPQEVTTPQVVAPPVSGAITEGTNLLELWDTWFKGFVTQPNDPAPPPSAYVAPSYIPVTAPPSVLPEPEQNLTYPGQWDGNPPFYGGGMAEGGTISGPTSGYELPGMTFHGKEHVTPDSEMKQVKSLLSQLVVGGSGESKNINLTVNLKVGTHEFRSLVMETIKVDPETQRQVRRVANG